MVTRGALFLSRMAALLAVVFALSSCGGGGGDSGFLGSGNPGGGGGGGNDDTGELAMTLVDPDGVATTEVTPAANGTLRVQVPDGGPDIVVEVSSSIGIVEPGSGSALTDDSGTAVFIIRAGNVTGAGTINASANVGSVTLQGSLNFQVGESELSLGYFNASDVFVPGEILIQPSSTLSAGGNAQLTVAVVDQDGERVTSPVDVTFDSGCISSGQASISPSGASQTVNGEAITIYTAQGCSGLDTVNASLSGAAAVATGTLDVASADVNSIEFVEAEPKLIVLRGTGGAGRSETSEVVFRVVDDTNLPIAGVTVNFELSTDVGGVELVQDSVPSDNDGLVRVTVQAGDISTNLTVLATVEDGNGQTVSTSSAELTVSTGLPDQNSISVSVAGCGGGEGFMIERGMTVDGICREIVVRMADKFNNPVVDGTSAIFTTEYGSIDSTCFTTDGECSVIWESQNPRLPTLTGDTYIKTIFSPGYTCLPTHDGTSGPCPLDFGFNRGGRSTITVHAVGEESFVDRNGNGVMDADEAADNLFANLPEAWFDFNEDGVYTPGIPACDADPLSSDQCISGNEEEFVDYNTNSVYDNNDAPAQFNGLLCPVEGDGVWCSRELLNVSDSTVLTLLFDQFYGILVTGGSPAGSASYGASSVFYISDLYNSPPAVGSSVKVQAFGDCVLNSESGYQVPIFTAARAWGIPVRVSEKASPAGVDSSIKITLSPKDLVDQIWEIPCS